MDARTYVAFKDEMSKIAAKLDPEDFKPGAFERTQKRLESVRKWQGSLSDSERASAPEVDTGKSGIGAKLLLGTAVAAPVMYAAYRHHKKKKKEREEKAKVAFDWQEAKEGVLDELPTMETLPILAGGVLGAGVARGAGANPIAGGAIGAGLASVPLLIHSMKKKRASASESALFLFKSAAAKEAGLMDLLRGGAKPVAQAAKPFVPSFKGHSEAVKKLTGTAVQNGIERVKSYNPMTQAASTQRWVHL